MRIRIEGGKPFWPDRLHSHLHKSLPHHPCHTKEKLVNSTQSSKQGLKNFVKCADGQSPTQTLSFLLQKAACGVGRAVLHHSLCRGGASWGGEWLRLLEEGST